MLVSRGKALEEFERLERHHAREWLCCSEAGVVSKCDMIWIPDYVLTLFTINPASADPSPR